MRSTGANADRLWEMALNMVGGTMGPYTDHWRNGIFASGHHTGGPMSLGS